MFFVVNLAPYKIVDYFDMDLMFVCYADQSVLIMHGAVSFFILFQEQEFLQKLTLTYKNQFDIYNLFISLENAKPSKMDRYSDVAITLRVSESSVRRAVQEMERTYNLDVNQ